MAENKKSFILYTSSFGVIKQLPDDVAGRLIKHILAYVNDEDPKTDELLVNVCFEPIKHHLKSDLEKYIISKHDRSLSGRIGNLKRWNKDLYDNFVSGKITIEEAEEIAKSRKESHSDILLSQKVAGIAVNANAFVNADVNVNLLKILNSFLLSEIKISNDTNFLEFGINKISISEKEKKYFKTAVWFQKLFIKNLKEKNSPITHQEKATYKKYVNPIRLMFESDKVSEDQIKQAYDYLNSLEGEFWKKNILSTETLRKKIPQLLIQKNTPNANQSTNGTKRPAKFTIAGAEKTLLADAERKQRKMDSNDN